MMRRAITTLGLCCALALAAAAPASAAFGFKAVDVTTTTEGAPALQAGSHPEAVTTTLEVNLKEVAGGEVPDDEFKNLEINLPPGLIATPDPVPHCAAADFLTIDLEHPRSNCPDSSAIGTTEVAASVSPIPVGTDPFQNVLNIPVYNLVAPPGAAAKFGFVYPPGLPVTIEAGLNTSPPYNAQAHVTNIPQAASFLGARLTLWGTPADPIHDAERGSCLGSKGTCSVGLPEIPFFTMPSACSGPMSTIFEGVSWQNPAAIPVKAVAVSHDDAGPQGVFGCSKLGFGPRIGSLPTTQSAESPSGLDFKIDVADEGLTSPDGIAQSDIKRAAVTLPAGVTINPSVAEGLKTCSEADLAREQVGSQPGEGCPQASKLGNVEVESPLLEGKLLKGSIFAATQDENPFHTMIALYMVIKSPELGLMVKLPGKVEPDPKTGQLVTTFGEPGFEIPQIPFSHFRFHFREGGRSPLVTPPACGAYTTKAELTPWANPASVLTTGATFEINSGVGGGPCPPAGVPPFHPHFEAGTINNAAGIYSPTNMRLTRADGEQDMTRFDTVLPPGLVAKLAGVPKCSNAAIVQAKAKTGRQELAAPSCPAATQIGRTLAGAGVGAELTYVPGKVYLGGPLGPDPLSIIAITPAAAGPFDAGTVVVHEALTLNPDSAEAEVDGANSDPIPHILKGIPLKLRDLRIYVDRPNFTLNPTSCEHLAFKATLFGGFTDVFSSADDVPVSLASPFQAADCASLAFAPKLALSLKGGTKRGAHPAFKAVVNARPGDANFEKAVVTLPHSAFLEQGHIRTVCTRVQFAANSCPKGSIYGKARAITPLLDEPLEGPVYLRSSSHPLPDLVVALHGLVDVNLVGRIDSVNARIRGSFESIPDAPVSKFILEMQGGKKGLIVNSRNLCAHKSKAKSQMNGQNGRAYDTSPVVVATSCKG